MIDYSLKFYKAFLFNSNEEVFKFFLAERTPAAARAFVEDYVTARARRYHLTDSRFQIKLIEVEVEDYGKEEGYQIIN